MNATDRPRDTLAAADARLIELIARQIYKPGEALVDNLDWASHRRRNTGTYQYNIRRAKAVLSAIIASGTHRLECISPPDSGAGE